MLADLGESDYTFLKRMASMIGYDFYEEIRSFTSRSPGIAIWLGPSRGEEMGGDVSTA